MSENKCPVVDRRKNTCPLSKKVAEQAADRAVEKFVLLFGYDVNSKDDMRKISNLICFLEAASNNTGKGKITILITLTSLVVTGICGMIWKAVTR